MTDHLPAPAASGWSRRSVLATGAAGASMLALAPAARAVGVAPGPGRVVAAARAGALELLTDPFLQAPGGSGISVAWMTEYAGAAHAVLIGEPVAGLSDAQLRAAATGTATAGVRVVTATSIQLSRVGEDSGSNLAVKPTPEEGIVDREVHRHEAVVPGLAPGSRTPYRIVSVDGADFAASSTFDLAPLPVPGQAATILLTSDHQAMVNTPANLQKAKETIGRIDAVFLAGDLINIPDRASEWFDDTRGSAFFPVLQGRGGRVSTGGDLYVGGEIIQSAALFPAVGNHEVQGRRAGLTALNASFNAPVPVEIAEREYAGVAASVNPTGDPAVKAKWIEDNSWSTTTYEEIFSLPSDSPGGERYYAVTVGDVRLISLFSTRIWRNATATPEPANRTANTRYQEAASTLADPLAQGYGEFPFESLAVGSEQYEWLAAEVASEEFQRAPIKVVMLHEGPQGLGDNIMPVFAEPDRIETRDAAGALTSVRYEYHPDDNMLLHDLQPLLEEAGVDIVHNGHSHLWNRFRSEGGTNFIETSNTGNTYGAYDGLSNRVRPLPPAPWDADNYLALGNPGGLEPILPSVKPFTNPDGVPLPFVQSNDLCVFTALETASRTVTTWAFDVKQPSVTPWVIDRFTVGRGATALSATATVTATGGVRISGSVAAETVADGEVTIRLGRQVLGRAVVSEGRFALTLGAGVLDVGQHVLNLDFARTRSLLPATMTLGVVVPRPANAAPPAATVVARAKPARKGKVKVVARVRAPGAGVATGIVEIRRANGVLLRRAQLRNGKAVVQLGAKRLGKGQVTLEVRYRGSATIAPAVGTVSFRATKRR